MRGKWQTGTTENVIDCELTNAHWYPHPILQIMQALPPSSKTWMWQVPRFTRLTRATKFSPVSSYKKFSVTCFSENWYSMILLIRICFVPRLLPNANATLL